MISSQASGRSVIAARTCHISSPSRTGPPGPASAGSQAGRPGSGCLRCARGSSACRDTAWTTVRGCAAVTAMATSIAVRPVPSTMTGLPSRDAPQRAGCPRVGDVAGAVRHRARRGGRGAADGQHRDVGVDVAVGREVQPQRVPRGAVADPDDLRGDRGDGGWPARPGAAPRPACRTGSARSRTCAGTRRARRGSRWPSAATGPGRRRPRSSCRPGSSAGDRGAWWSTPGRARAGRRRRSARCAPAAARRRPGGAGG